MSDIKKSVEKIKDFVEGQICDWVESVHTLKINLYDENLFEVTFVLWGKKRKMFICVTNEQMEIEWSEDHWEEIENSYESAKYFWMALLVEEEERNS